MMTIGMLSNHSNNGTKIALEEMKPTKERTLIDPETGYLKQGLTIYP